MKKDVVDEVAKLWRLVPSMRLGQLLSWLLSSAGMQPEDIGSTSDSTLATLASDVVPVAESFSSIDTAQIQEDVLAALSRESARHPDIPLGKTVLLLAAWGGFQCPWKALYHIEDESLLAGAQIPEELRFDVDLPSTHRAN